jgi:osmoprotectant transport system permease protein
MSAGTALRAAACLVLALGLFTTGAQAQSGDPDPDPDPDPGAAREVSIGSKKFTESVVLGEVLSSLAREAGAVVQHRRELGGTRVLWSALLRGQIDAYPEYTGTIAQEILGGRVEQAGIAGALPPEIRMSRPLGFNNTYAIGMVRARAEELGITRVSELARHPGLRFGFTTEFMDREDGWPGLSAQYRLRHEEVRGLDHDLAYRGLRAGDLDVTDLYSTDADIRYYDLAVLEDDRRYFPEYQAVIVYRADLAERAPEVLAQLLRLEGAIDESRMIAMNAAVKLERVAEPEVAAAFLQESFGVETSTQSKTALDHLLANTLEHLWLVGVSLSGAIVLAIPLGVLCARRERLGQLVLGAVGIIQTIPSLALLVFMIPLLGIGAPPAIAALFLYSLLPIVRNTYAGLHDIPDALRESAEALGLPPGARLRVVELPLAARSILAGIKTSSVINVGTATLGALIGAGGYGQPILTGIRLDDVGLILQGAIPAAGLALVVQGGFELAERAVVPAGLRISRED